MFYEGHMAAETRNHKKKKQCLMKVVTVRRQEKKVSKMLCHNLKKFLNILWRTAAQFDKNNGNTIL
jgi:hypothetical protein